MPMFGQSNPFVRPTATAYQPTIRDKTADYLLSVLGDGALSNHFVQGLLGSTGLGHTGQGLVDWLPNPFSGDEAGRQMASGHPLSGAGNLFLAAAPLPAVGKGAKGMIGSAARAAIKDAERAAPIVGYHGSPITDLTGLTARPGPSKMGFTPVVSVSMDPAFAARYAGDSGRVYKATVNTSNLGDFRNPEQLASAKAFFDQQYGPLDAYDQEALAHGAWRFWEDPGLWKSHGWDGAWVREEPGRGDANALNLSLANGNHVRLSDGAK